MNRTFSGVWIIGFWVSVVGASVLTAFHGCTDAERSKLYALGDPAKIQCYSGSEIIYSGCSTGKVLSEEGSDGYYFRDKADDILKEVSGNCIVQYGHPECR